MVKPETDESDVVGPGDGAAAPPEPRPAPRRKRFKWGFPSAVGAILALMVAGQAAGLMLADYRLLSAEPKDWIFSAFLLSAGWLFTLQRGAVWHFLRSMPVGVSLVGLSCLSIITGVLVPQIDGFEDPDQRVTEANYEEQYKAFRWAEGYFLYHLMHPYGIGMPEAVLPPGIDERLDAFGRKYGREEQKNRAKQMDAVFTSGPKSRAIGQLIDANDALMRRFFDLCTFLHLNRAYKSHWFATLLTLLAGSVFANLWRGRPRNLLSVRKIGFVVTHVGVLTLLVGGAISKSRTVRGILNLDLREPPQRVFLAFYNRADKRRLPFWVGLERFARLDWKQIEVGFRDADLTTRPPTYTLWKGRTIDLDFVDDGAGGLRPRIRLEVLDLSEHAHVGDWALSEATPEQDGLGPVALLSVPDMESLLAAVEHGQDPELARRMRRDAYLIPGDSRQELHYDLAWQYRLRAVRVEGSKPPADLFPGERILGHLLVRELAEGEVEAHRVPVSLGDVIDAPGGYRIEVVDATAHYSLDSQDLTEVRDVRPLAEQVPLRPGVWVEITPPEGGQAERRLVLENVDAEQHGKQETYEYDDLVVKLEWERWACEGPPRFALYWGPDVAPHLVCEASGAAVPVAAGARLDLPGEGEVLLKQALNDAWAERTVELQLRRVTGDGFDESFYSVTPRGLELSITTDPGRPEEKVEVVRMASTGANLADRWQSPDGRFYVLFFENDSIMPFEWRSVLTVYDDDPDGRWHLYSGADGRLLHSYDAAQSKVHSDSFGGEIIQLQDQDGDGRNDFAGPVRRIELGSQREREIRVNDYFKHAGYRFFQTNADPSKPTYSGIGVVLDPGIPTVLAGMYTIILGTVLAFIVRPIVEAARKRRAAA